MDFLWLVPSQSGDGYLPVGLPNNLLGSMIQGG
jgi:hypothetical protein